MGTVKERGVSSLIIFLVLAVAVAVVAGGYLTLIREGEGKTGNPTGDNSKLQSAGMKIEGEENLSRLLLHLMTRFRSRPEFSLFPGELPENLPVQIPFPENSELIGSVEADSESTDRTYQIIIHVQANSESAIEFYRNQLTKAGWVEKSEQDRWGSGGGFTSIPAWGSDALFCRHENEGPVLTIRTSEPEGGGPLDVRFSLQNDHPVLREDRPSRYEDRGVLPELEPPEGVHQMSSGGGSHGGDYSSETSEARLDTSMGLEELEAHYNDQLLEAGWNFQEEVAIENLVLSSYTFKDNEGNLWSATLSIQAVGEEKRLAFLRAYTTS